MFIRINQNIYFFSTRIWSVYRLTSLDCEHLNSSFMMFQDHFLVVGSVCYLYFGFVDVFSVTVPYYIASWWVYSFDYDSGRLPLMNTNACVNTRTDIFGLFTANFYKSTVLRCDSWWLPIIVNCCHIPIKWHNPQSSTRMNWHNSPMFNQETLIDLNEPLRERIVQ